MNLFQLSACACIALLAAAKDWPGPQRTQMENGVEVWKAKADESSDTVYTYKGAYDLEKKFRPISRDNAGFMVTDDADVLPHSQ